MLESKLRQQTPVSKTDAQTQTPIQSSPSPQKMDEKGVHFPINAPKSTVLNDGTASPIQTVIGKDASNPFMAVTLPKSEDEGADATEEIKSTAEITNWLTNGLQHYLPPEVEPNLKKLGLAGHTRGGKVAFALALGRLASISTDLKFSALIAVADPGIFFGGPPLLIGVDPVDGMDKGKQTPPSVLTYILHSFNSLDMPVMDYGHNDMLDDETKGIRGKATYCLCTKEKSRVPMRKFVGGVLVAFLKAYLEGNSSNLVAIRDGNVTLPVELQDIDFLVQVLG
ncbi:hypothetical protein BC332_15451 [Capsicum chinense]|nr:hypothetical protein BC332_15451 [Capsicum chinense]